MKKHGQLVVAGLALIAVGVAPGLAAAQGSSDYKSAPPTVESSSQPMDKSASPSTSGDASAPSSSPTDSSSPSSMPNTSTDTSSSPSASPSTSTDTSTPSASPAMGDKSKMGTEENKSTGPDQSGGPHGHPDSDKKTR